MTPGQLAELRKRMAANRQPVERSPWAHHEHPRGWNDCLDWVDRNIREVMGEKVEGQEGKS